MDYVNILNVAKIFSGILMLLMNLVLNMAFKIN